MKRMLVALLVLSMFMSFTLPAYACTEWAATGSAVEGGGTLIIKNRDWIPNQIQELKLFTPVDGYRYFGINIKDIGGMVKGGINEYGLVVFNQAAETTPGSERKQITPYLTDMLLKKCKNVDEVIAMVPTLVGPIILNIADKNKIANIELGLNGTHASITSEDGVIYHTNHLLAENLLGANTVEYPGSHIRYQRIGELLKSVSKPYTLKNFIDFSQDQNDGPDSSIWRTGSTTEQQRTLATFAAKLPKQGSPTLYILMANPGQEFQYVNLQADDIFSGKAGY